MSYLAASSDSLAPAGISPSFCYPFYYVMHRIWANQHVQFYEAIFESPQALLIFFKKVFLENLVNLDLKIWF